MKRTIAPLLIAVILLPALSACGKYDYFSHVSDLKSDIFCAETEDFTLSVSCVKREHPFLTDGVVSPLSSSVEAVLTEKNPSGAEYSIALGGGSAGEMSFRSVTGDYYFSRGTSEFPEGSLSVRVIRDGTATDLVATSVKTKDTLPPESALSKAIEAERETVGAMTRGKTFFGEFHVRLLRRDKTYYYVGIVSDSFTVSLLLDSESGEVLARRKTDGVLRKT